MIPCSVISYKLCLEKCALLLGEVEKKVKLVMEKNHRAVT